MHQTKNGIILYVQLCRFIYKSNTQWDPNSRDFYFEMNFVPFHLIFLFSRLSIAVFMSSCNSCYSETDNI